MTKAEPQGQFYGGYDDAMAIYADLPLEKLLEKRKKLAAAITWAYNNAMEHKGKPEFVEKNKIYLIAVGKRIALQELIDAKIAGGKNHGQQRPF